MVRDFVDGYDDGVQESVINRPRRLVTNGRGLDLVSAEDNLAYWAGYAMGRLDWRNNDVDRERAKQCFMKSFQ